MSAAFDPVRLKERVFPPVRQRYDARQTAAYALSVGFGQDPLDPVAGRYTWGPELLAVPTMAVVLCHPGFWMQDEDTGIDWRRIVHGEQRLIVHRPLVSQDELIGRTRVLSVTDKGPRVGALLQVERSLYRAVDETPVATQVQVVLARGNGGFSDGGLPSDPLPPALIVAPDAAPDHVLRLAARPEAALWYRLNGDFNPLHVDPSVAEAVGFSRPILHGLCTYGMAACAVLQQQQQNKPFELAGLDVRFSAPMYPGETLEVSLWRHESGMHVAARSVERDIWVLTHGFARFKPSGIFQS